MQRAFHYKTKTKTNANTNAPSPATIITDLQAFFLTKQMFVKKSQQIKPTQKDSLFWCYYILKNGQSSYEKLLYSGDISYVKERQIKIELVEQLRAEVLRNKLKLCKLSSIDHIENQLANEQTIDLATFFSLCFLDNIQVFYFKNKCFYKTLKEDLPWMASATTNTIPPTHLDLFETIYDRDGTGYDEDDYDFATIHLLKTTAGKYWIEECPVLDIDWNTSYHIENVNKPLRAISAYTAQQLKELANNFGIAFKGKKKQEVYDLVKSFVKIDII